MIKELTLVIISVWNWHKTAISLEIVPLPQIAVLKFQCSP